MQVGFSLAEARDMSPDETERFIALHNAHNRPQKQQGEVRPGVRKATQADINAFLGSFGG